MSDESFPPASASSSEEPSMKRYRPARSDYRSRSHQSAHEADAANGSHPPPPDHPLIPRGETGFVQTQDALEALLARLRAAGRFAYDSEFIGELSYVPKLCLIQVCC